LLNLIASMSYNGSVQNSMTEAVLFRTKGMLCIDEFEKSEEREVKIFWNCLIQLTKKG